MGSTDGHCERRRAARDGDKMDMIGHEAIGEDDEAVSRQLLGEKIEVGASVVIDEEDILPVVAALNDMMRRTGHTNASDAGHARDANRRRVCGQPAFDTHQNR